MKFFFFLVAGIAAAAVQNIDLLATKAFNLGLVAGKVTDKATCKDIMKCIEPSVLARKPIANITSDAKNCLVSKSGKFYMSVINLYNTMNKCLVGDALTMLGNILSVGKPIVEPLYKTLMTKIGDWTAKKLPTDTIANNTWGWINGQVNKNIINEFCSNIVNKKAVNKTEWACAKNPGNQAIDFSSYACYKLTPAT